MNNNFGNNKIENVIKTNERMEYIPNLECGHF